MYPLEQYSRVVEEEVVPVLRVEEAGRAVAWYARLGFAKEWEHQFEPGFPWFVSVARGRVRLYLSEHTGDAAPNTLIHLYVNDVEAGQESSVSQLTRTVWPVASATYKTSTETACGSPPRAANPCPGSHFFGLVNRGP